MTFGIKRMGLLSHALRLTDRDLEQFGKTLIIAPHPDDESLACGGLISLLRNHNTDVQFIFVSDGAMSHPLSQEFSATQRSEIRKKEAENALVELDVDPKKAIFLDFPDGSVPNTLSEDCETAVKSISRVLLNIQPDTIFIPFRLDPHRDHQATWQLMQRALTAFRISPRVFEYPVWLWELGREEEYAEAADMTIWRLDIGTELDKKRKAIAAHQSQLGHVFLDDASGFVLTPNLLAHFEHPFEIFFESK